MELQQQYTDAKSKLQDKLTSVKGSVHGKWTSAKDSISGMGNKAIVIVLAVMIVAFSINSLKVVHECEKQGYDGKSSTKTIRRNRNIITTTTGIGVGLIAYVLFGMIIPQLSLILFGSFLCVISIIFIRSYEKIEDTANCKQKILDEYNMAYGLLGAGLGLILFAGLSTALGAVKSPTMKARVIPIFASIIAATISGVGINTSNNCDDGNKTGGGKYKTGAILTLVMSIVVLMGLTASFYFYPV